MTILPWRKSVAVAYAFLLVGAVALAGCGSGPAKGKTAGSGTGAASGAKTITVPAGMPTSISLKGWHVSTSGAVAISSSVGDPNPPSLMLPADGQSYVWADLGQPVDQFSFDVKTQGLFDFFFGANDSGQGYMFRIDTRGGTNYSGFSTTKSWTEWDCPGKGPNTDPSSTWIHVVLTIQGTNVTATLTGKGLNQNYIFSSPSIVSCTTSGQPKVLFDYKPVGNAFGFQGDGLGATSDTWIANFE